MRETYWLNSQTDARVSSERVALELHTANRTSCVFSLRDGKTNAPIAVVFRKMDKVGDWQCNLVSSHETPGAAIAMAENAAQAEEGA